ncbi:hypothetical protein QUB47_07690 [Microcoleus sp. AT9_B5]
MSLLRKIQENTCNPDFKVSDILRQCKILAARLEYQPLKIWLEYELNGYRDQKILPEYRIIKEVLFEGTFTNGAWLYKNYVFNISKHLLDSSGSGIDISQINTIYLRQNISALESLIRTDESNLKFAVPGNIALLLGQFVDNLESGYHCVSASQVINVSTIVSILDIVKSKILDFTLQIEAENPKAGDVEIGDKPIPDSILNIVFNNTISGRHVGDNISCNGGGSNVITEKNMSDSKYDQRGANFSEGDYIDQKGSSIGIGVNKGEVQAEKIAGTINEAQNDSLQLIELLRQQIEALDNQEVRREALEHLDDLATEIQSSAPKPSRIKAFSSALWNVVKDISLVANAVTALAERFGVHLLPLR